MPPAPGPRYIVPEGEVEREAKQLASDIAYALTTYEESDSSEERLLEIAGERDLALLSEVSAPSDPRGTMVPRRGRVPPNGWAEEQQGFADGGDTPDGWFRARLPSSQ